jgi:hypothetical protein
MRSRFSLTNAEMAAALSISIKTLKRMRQAGFFRPGTHFVLAGSGAIRQTYRWDPQTTEAALEMKTRKLVH